MIRTLAATALVSAMTVTPGFAAQPESITRKVRYADLDLSTASGIQTLHRRVARALETVCGSYAGTETVGAETEAATITKCRAAAEVKADRRIAQLLSARVQTASAR